MSRPDDPELIAQLLALVAHDLRNPLSALHSNAGYLQSTMGKESDDLREALDDVVSSCTSLGSIIDNLELLGVALEDAPVVDLAPLSLSDVATEALQQCQALARSYRVELRLEQEPGAEASFVMTNRDMLRRALANVIRNAIQHGSRDVDVTITVGKGVVRVEDGGAALAPELAERAFTAEGQLECKSHPAGRYSRGLGLFAAAVAAKAAGAKLSPVAARKAGRSAFELRVALADV
ncbi:MAG TPA: HAMP domain-containing sensor histidine kinase [Polyangiaceae bacterium]|nr:HAMP domain-containing sensor histidine kinase [Polyangiaceae bacterium]